ncbi:MAG: hypothetical protein ACRD72_09025 [Candidatus Angelobacter sp.]
MKLTAQEMVEARQKVNNLIAQIGNSNELFAINQALDNLDLLFAAFEKSGQFVDEEQPHRRGGWNTDKKNAAEKKDHSDEVFGARTIIARAGLRLLQQAIPALKQISDRCLEIAGKEAVRAACKPDEILGTDLNGKPYAPRPSEFTLPEGYETVGSKVKAAIGL